MGPFMYNVFTNDLLLMMQRLNNCNVFNYADDNTISAFSETIAGVERKLHDCGTEMVNWFKENLMQANPAKFQYILFGTTEDRRLELTGGTRCSRLCKAPGCRYRQRS